VDNSGVMIPPVEEVTVQKYDSQFGTNVMGTCVIVYPFHMQADLLIHEMCRPLAVHETAVACAFCSHRRVPDARESTYCDSVVIRELSCKGDRF
jgi:hypothetical protein